MEMEISIFISIYCKQINFEKKYLATLKYLPIVHFLVYRAVRIGINQKISQIIWIPQMARLWAIHFKLLLLIIREVNHVQTKRNQMHTTVVGRSVEFFKANYENCVFYVLFFFFLSPHQTNLKIAILTDRDNHKDNPYQV